MNKLQKNNTYYYTDRRTFKNPFDNVHYFIKRNYEIGMHKQDFFEINIVIRGKGIHYISDNKIDAEVGDVFIIPPEVEHGYVGGEGFDVYHIVVSNGFMQKNIAELQSINGFSTLFKVEPIIRAKVNNPLHLKLKKSQLKALEEILTERKNKRPIYTPEEWMLNSASFLIIVTRLCEAYVENFNILADNFSVKDSYFMRALALIHEKFNEKLSVADLAAEAHLSESTFVRKFIYVCKQTPFEYIVDRRIEAAENMLLNSTASLVEIAEKVGFYDSAHLCRTFKKKKGVTPKEYRKLKAESFRYST
ncbi:MAG: helix-turn-helix transcriptional regulator [Clostridia bacterium]|nr:helix-turn-helix transcriptional regulator [Clostridia bacterium]